MIDSSLFIRHCNRILNRLCQFRSIPWVDNNTSIQRLCSASKFTENHDSVTSLLSTDIFVRYLHANQQDTGKKEHEIHSVTGGTDETDIADAVEGDEFGKVDGLMHKVNWHEFDTAELAVDPSHEFIDCSPKVLVLFHIASGRNCHLNQDHLSVSWSKRGRGREPFHAIQGGE